MDNIKREFLKFSGNVPSVLALYESTDSTNERAKRGLQYDKERSVPCPLTEQDGKCDCVELCAGLENTQLFIADVQSAGRGRLGRSFASPAGAGLYMSLKIRINKPLCDTIYVTPYAAVCAAHAIERLCSADIKIKWVNDLYIGDKKLAGILTESVPSECCDTYSTLVIGIGINIKKGALPPELSDIATSLEGEGFAVDRARLAVEIAHELLSGIYEPDTKKILAEYRRMSNLIGERVTVSTSVGEYEAGVRSIGDGFELIAEHDGITEKLISADIIRIKKHSKN